MAFTTVTITNDYDLANGIDPTGTVTFTPTAPMVNGPTVVAAPVVGRLDIDGILTIDLAANTDGATSPSGVTYLVEEAIGGATRTYYVRIPHDQGSTLVLSTLATAGVAPAISFPAKVIAGPTIGVFSVKDYGATGNGTTNDTTAIQSASDAASAAGGIVSFPMGTYLTNTLTYYSNTRWVGAGRGATTIKLAASQNTDLLKSYQFATFTGTTTDSGAHHVGFQDLAIDGNKANQSSGAGAGIKHYGAMITMERVIIRNCRGDGLYSEWNPASDVITDGCESVIHAVASHDNGTGTGSSAGSGFNYRGSHDSVFSDCIAFGNAYAGFWIRTTASASQCHSWSNATAQAYAWRLEDVVYLSNSQGEGASVAQVAALSNDCMIVGGKYFAGSVNNGKGIIIGDASHTGIAGTRVETTIQDCPLGLIDFTYSSGIGFININAYSSGTGVVGTPPNNEHCHIAINGGASGPFTSVGGYMQAVGEFTAKNSSGQDLFDVFTGAVSVANGPTVDFYSGNYTGQTAQIKAATGGIRPGTTAGMGATIYSGSGAPTSLNGTAGDFYLRTGTPTTANQRIYICTTTGTPGTWSGIA